ncbi:HAD-IA family hydrolase [Yoonia sp. SS1-5]|uniref:HAD-IA family hydrolase n=1 Tax=Yoonia rhodophyticola TaxID=3137370 RepID=A0ABZ3JCL2_9RHOB
MKSAPAIYQLLLARNALRPQDCLFIDDSPKNIAGAERLGINGILFQTAKQLKDDLRDIDIL